MGVLVWCSDGVMYSHVEETPRVYSGFPGCKRDEGTSVNGIFTTLTGVVLLVQMVMNIANSNNNENKKNENNQNNNNNNNVATFDNIFVSMNENQQTVNGMSMFLGRGFEENVICREENQRLHDIIDEDIENMRR